MAKAELGGQNPVRTLDREVILKLSPEEAITLLTLLGHVGDDKSTTPRQFLDPIFSALREIQVPWIKSELVGKIIQFQFPRETMKRIETQDTYWAEDY